MTMQAEVGERPVVIGGCPFKPSVRDVAPDRGLVLIRDGGAAPPAREGTRIRVTFSRPQLHPAVIE
jgi:hypothetical protein